MSWWYVCVLAPGYDPSFLSIFEYQSLYLLTTTIFWLVRSDRHFYLHFLCLYCCLLLWFQRTSSICPCTCAIHRLHWTSLHCYVRVHAIFRVQYILYGCIISLFLSIFSFCLFFLSSSNHKWSVINHSLPLWTFRCYVFHCLLLYYICYLQLICTLCEFRSFGLCFCVYGRVIDEMTRSLQCRNRALG